MAPVKRTTTTAQRETRATRAATVAKKKTVALDKKPEVQSVSKTLLTETRPTATARRGKKTAPEEQVDEHTEIEGQESSVQKDAMIKSASTRATRSTGPSTGLAAAPRRRVKITPINAPISETNSKTSSNPTVPKARRAAPNSKSSTLSKSTTTETQDELMQDVPVNEETVKSTRRTTKPNVGNTSAKPPSSKPKGRPRTQKADKSDPAPAPAPEPVNTATTRTTRSRRAESIISSDAPVSSVNAAASKPLAGVRKKVTFQDLPLENDKENQPLSQAKSKKGLTKVTEDTQTSKGLRAKPLRKAATTTTTRGRKMTKETDTKENESKEERKMPRALTPKKITQVARSSPSEREIQNESDSEDELNGSKTPIRDLSISPRRPPTAALARLLSPAKKLDFGQSLMPKSPDRTAVFRDSEAEQTGMLASPARRPAGSSFKDSLKESPKRGLNENAKLLFPSNSEASASIASNVANLKTAVQAMPTMLQSPKRVGGLEPNFFSQSAMKKSVSKSPLKTSLFGSPAKRLFSPVKKSSGMSAQKNTPPQEDDEQPNVELELESEISASSHFRSGSSPLRVVRANPEYSEMDFDDSILEVARSPLKIQKSPHKEAPQYDPEASTDGEEKAQGETTHTCIDDLQPSEFSIQDRSASKQRESPIPSEQVDMRGITEGVEDTISIPVEERQEIGSDLQPIPVAQPSLSQVLFRSTTSVTEDESSEDELAGGVTPVRAHPRNRVSMTSIRDRSRLSAGVPQSINGKDFGFTPLAAQMSGWLATSPETSPENDRTRAYREGSTEFSPLARQHIDGEVVLSRNSTPVQKLSKDFGTQPVSIAKSVASNRRSMNLRKSLATRQSLGLFSSTDSPARNQQFDEYMEIRAMEEQADSEQPQMEFELGPNDRDFHDIMDMDEESASANEEDDTVLEYDNDNSRISSTDQAGDLTTDLIKFTHVSDTAMVDFQGLAREADNMACEEVEMAGDEVSPINNLEASALNDDASELLETQDFDQSELSSEVQANSPATPNDADIDRVPVDEVHHEVHSPRLEPFGGQLNSPSILIIDQIGSCDVSTSSAGSDRAVSPAPELILRTPQQRLKLTEQRIINTVVSKVPLKPEGLVSPIKMPKKRSQSFGDTGASPAKRISLEDLRALAANAVSDTFESPDRRVRTSVAPSPGGTSTPSATRSNTIQTGRYSLSAMSTPGQVSFMVDDFGDSTLDGIELPDDFADETEHDEEKPSPAQSVRSSVSVSTVVTPKATVTRTPATARRSKHRTTTPTTANKKMPKSAQKVSGNTSNSANVERTPLGPVGKGLLHGAIVFVDVHTSEGADASGIFIELLTQMGAKCAREWRWNPRTSLAPNGDDAGAEQNIGITHVVFKDGSKRTLEKVRDAKGDVCCVGVAWVLDCERESKWLDESSYMIDTKVLPRGGSNRRKSMEPRALLVGNDGSVSTSRPRRSVSAEMSELMKQELLKTPARDQSPSSDQNDDDDENDENLEQATPTGFIAYDPRMAMTPGTPYLVSQGKHLAQMSAPPKQQNKSIFDDEDEENEDTFLRGESGNAGAVKDAKKFRMKNLGDMAKRRRTLGWKPAVGSPLRKI